MLRAASTVHEMIADPKSAVVRMTRRRAFKVGNPSLARQVVFEQSDGIRECQKINNRIKRTKNEHREMERWDLISHSPSDHVTHIGNIHLLVGNAISIIAVISSG